MTACAILFLVACNNESESPEATTDSTNKSSASTMNTLTDEEKKEGWQLLFDGNTLGGWHEYGLTTSSGLWKIVDGSLYFDGDKKKADSIKDDHNIVTDADYANFHLKLEWKVDTGANSGIIFYVNEDTSKFKKPYETGPEMQVLDNERHPDAKINKHRAGDLYDLIACSVETVKPALEWNQAEIVSKDGQLDLFLNGTKVVSTKMWDDNWKKMVAASKFKQWPDFATFKKGHIALQDHGNVVWYKNIMIKKL